MVVLALTEAGSFAVDQNSIADAEDGGVSAVIMLFYDTPIKVAGRTIVATAGRMEFFCNRSPMLVRAPQVIYGFEEQNLVPVAQETVRSKARIAQEDSSFFKVGTYVCNQQHPATTKRDTK